MLGTEPALLKIRTHESSWDNYFIMGLTTTAVNTACFASDCCGAHRRWERFLRSSCSSSRRRRCIVVVEILRIILILLRLILRLTTIRRRIPIATLSRD